MADEPCVWLGIGDWRMHLTQAHVLALLPALQGFAATGRLTQPHTARRAGKPVVYVSGPYSSDPVSGTRAAVLVAEDLWRLGAVPLVPHLSLLADLISPRSYEEWLEQDLALVARCDALVRLHGESAGADQEVAYAQGLGLPVFISGDLAKWVRGRGEKANKGGEA